MHLHWQRIQKIAARFFVHTAQIVFIVFLVRFFVGEPGLVNGRSMEPTFDDDDVMWINKMSFMIRAPRRFEVVQFFKPSSELLLIKRVIGLPKETIFIKRNSVYVQTKEGKEIRLNEPYLAPFIRTNGGYSKKTVIEVPEDSYAVLGDNRPFSGDSRDFGPVHRSYITGKVWRVTHERD